MYSTPLFTQGKSCVIVSIVCWPFCFYIKTNLAQDCPFNKQCSLLARFLALIILVFLCVNRTPQFSRFTKFSAIYHYIERQFYLPWLNLPSNLYSPSSFFHGVKNDLHPQPFNIERNFCASSLMNFPYFHMDIRLYHCSFILKGAYRFDLSGITIARSQPHLICLGST